MAENKEKHYVSDNAQLMTEWDWEKNNELGYNPNQMLRYSNKRVWWKCQNGHKWESIICNRTKGRGCPYCAGQKVVIGYNDLQTINPILSQEWNHEKNNGLTPADVMPNSNKKVWWKCPQDHEWQAIVVERNSGNGCPYCSGRRAIIGRTDLTTVNPSLSQEWNYEKNGVLMPEDFTAGSGKKVWWKCPQGHEWQAAIADRNNGNGCPYCSNKKVLVGYNDLKTVNQTLAQDWNYERNNGLTPADVMPNSNKKVWWKCPQDHEWRSTITCRHQGHGCPYCSGRYAIKGENDLQTINPTLAQEWNYEKNNGLTPADVMPNSGKKVWWKCEQGHEWQARIDHRNNNVGCPYCSGRFAIIGKNDLQTLNPILAREWDYNKNGDLRPENISANSNHKAWWRCTKGHEWQAVISSRNAGCGCPICNSERSTSFPEYVIVYYLRKHGLNVIHSYKDNGYELDIYIPTKFVAIEYDGYYWHKNKANKELEKNRKCQRDGITLYRIREELPPLNDTSIDYVVFKNQQNLPDVLKDILYEIIGETIDIDIKRDYIAIESMREHAEKNNSVLLCNPRLAQEWNYEKNGTLTPENVTANSEKKVWWKCVKGHEWQTTVAHRNRGRGCPYCAGQKVIIGCNDLKTINPTLAQEWNYEKNNGLTPIDVMPNSGKKVWWKCHQGHEWQAIIQSRNKGNGCPYCSRRKKQEA